MRRITSLATLLLGYACSDAPTTVPSRSVPVASMLTVPATTDAALMPTAGARLLYDLREQLQRHTALAPAIAPWTFDEGDAPSARARITPNADGAGTHAIRIDWPGMKKGCHEVSPSFGVTLPKPWPRRAYVRWNQLAGRTRSGGGVGEVGRFEVDTDACGDLEGRFVWTVSREDAPGGHRRIDLRWWGDALEPTINIKKTDVLLSANQGWSYAPLDRVGTAAEYVMYLQAESRSGAGDGIVRLWVDGRLLLEHTGVAAGAEAFRRMNFPWTMAAAARQQTEYFWGLVAWEAPVGMVTLDDAPARLAPGQTAALVVRVADVHGAEIGGHVPVRWSSSDEAVVSVTTAGAVRAVAPGEATITAEAGGRSASHRITVIRPGVYVAPDGRADADGSWDAPLDLATALQGGRVAPGTTVWLRGGVYRGDFRSSLAGTASERTIVRQLPGERATIEGRLRADGAHVTYQGFEIRQANALATNDPTLEAYGEGTRYVNLVIHDAGENGISFRTAAGVNEVYGCIVFNNGNDRGLDQGIYAPNDGGEKWIADNVFFNNMASGIQVFGDESHPVIADVHVVGNIAFNNSSIAATPTRPPSEENITVGGDMLTRGVTVADNLVYFSGITGQNLRIGLEPDSDRPGRRNVDAVVRGNYAVGGATVFRIQHWESAVVERNTFVTYPGQRIIRMGGGLAGYRWTGNVFHADASAVWNHNGTQTRDAWRAITGFGATDQLFATPPAAPHVVVRPNKYERGRAHIAIVNWPRAAAVAVDLGGVLNAGDRYELRNVQDVFGAPVVAGVYDGAPVMVPMTGVQPPAAIGRPGAAPRTGPDFDVFLLTLAGG